MWRRVLVTAFRAEPAKCEAMEGVQEWATVDVRGPRTGMARNAAGNEPRSGSAALALTAWSERDVFGALWRIVTSEGEPKSLINKGFFMLFILFDIAGLLFR